MTTPKANNIFTISACQSFTDTLAADLIRKYENDVVGLGRLLILLPTRRACKNMQDAFLRQSQGAPIILPRLKPIGDVDDEELLISSDLEGIEDINDAISTIERQIILANLISKLPDISNGIAADMRLANALGVLLDQTYTEGLNLKDLLQIIDNSSLSDHWQITVQFLEIISKHWPEILNTRGLIDGADRRNRLMNLLHDSWQKNPPNHLIIAAGSTGSIPATRKILKLISSFEMGSVILPGLDLLMGDTAWNMVEEGHPQYTLKELLEYFECDRSQVQLWPTQNSNNDLREKFISDVMLPPEVTHTWQDIDLNEKQKNNITNDLKTVQIIECDTAQEEAKVIALLLREIIEKDNKTAALITPDRQLARRVSLLCKRWNVEIDDSSGTSLNKTSLGIYLKLIINATSKDFSPVSILSLLKHNLCHGNDFKNYRKTVRLMDIHLLRGITPSIGWDGLEKLYHKKLNDKNVRIKPKPECLELIDHLKLIFMPLSEALKNDAQDFKTILQLHLQIAEKLNYSSDINVIKSLWMGDIGNKMAEFLSSLQTNIEILPQCTINDYLEIFDQFLSTQTVRPIYGTHPRLMILGQLEARLIQTDRVIMAGLNEGTWPPDPGHDPWMSRPMRDKFGLPKAERAITLAAHDFAQGFCGKEVFLTRAKRDNGAPSVPARWLQRIDTLLDSIKIDKNILRQSPYLQYAAQLDDTAEKIQISRPEPRPPTSARPRQISVTKIEKWMKDPYSIYANSILKLNAIEPIEKEIGAMEHGNIIHEIMDEFTKKFPKQIPNNAVIEFINIAQDVCKEQGLNESQLSFWMPRIYNLAQWVVNKENEWRKMADFGKSEVGGQIILSENLQADFKLTCRADRIDYLKTGAAAIIDYKSGNSYPITKIKNGALPQLPLEALILSKNGFKDSEIHQIKTENIAYWKLTGKKNEAGKIFEINNEDELNDIIKNSYEKLLHLIQTFDKAETPYLAIPRLDNAPNYNDYEHLERVKEWTALGEQSEDAA